MNEQNTFEAQPIAWRPTEEVIKRAQLTRFMKQVGVANWDELYEFSTRDVEKFTSEVLSFLEIGFDPPYTKLLDISEGIEWAKWCVGGGLNITEMCLDRWAESSQKNQPAVIWEDEEGEVRRVSYKMLLAEVETIAASLRRRGLGKGDAIGIHLPMMVETVVALLAINRIGAIAVPVFSGYGVDAIASRLNAVGAKALFTCDGFPRRGKEFKAFEVATAAVAVSPTVEHVFIVTRLHSGSISWDLPDVKVEFYDLELIGDGEEMRLDSPAEFATLSAAEKTLAEDPLIILYTSGTTGKPKGIAHTHCGFPIKAAQDMAFGTDVGRGTRISWVTDLGWMMGPWLIYGGLINGATIVIYDGAPDYPEADRMWEFCANHKVEILGISPTLVRALATKGDDLPKKHDLSHLRAFASTGEPWNPAPWWWLFEKVGDSKLPIINYSGGTEISGGILMGNPLLPIKPCSFPAPCPGIDAVLLGEDGEPVMRGKVGELAIRKPWIGMARGFWKEPERYIETYWSRFKKIWVHGDWSLQDEDGHWYILGRSDDTLKVAGKRVGPAEVESLLVAHALVTEAAVIGVPDEVKGTAMVAFCVLNGKGDEALRAELKNLVAKDMGKPLAPSRIHFLSALPKTRNAKVMRRVIRSAYLGEDAGDVSALENPATVDEIRKLKE
ncbi:MAG: AMP-binding protein [Acidobacteria bacterium]|nr:AMP-binding protein [Acidobacteriota bacterium]